MTGINNLVPQIAIQVEQIHKPQMLEVQEQFLVFQQKLVEEVDNYQNKLTNLTKQCIEEVLII